VNAEGDVEGVDGCEKDRRERSTYILPSGPYFHPVYMQVDYKAGNNI